MSITEGQQLKSSSNSKTFTVSCFWKEITCSDEDQEDESGIPTKTHFRKPGTQCSQLARGCRWAAGLRELLLRLHTAICLYPSRKTGPLLHMVQPSSPHCPPTLTNFGEKFQPAFWVRARIHVYTEAGGSLLFSDHVLTGVVCY